MKNRKTAKCKSQNVKVALYDAYFSEKLKVKSEKFPILTLRYLRLCVKKINAEGVKKMREKTPIIHQNQPTIHSRF